MLGINGTVIASINHHRGVVVGIGDNVPTVDNETIIVGDILFCHGTVGKGTRLTLSVVDCDVARRGGG